MSILELMAFAKSRLKSNEPAYKERVEVTLTLLRSLGILPHTRISINGKLHTKHHIQYASRQLNHPTQLRIDNVLAAA